MNGLDLASLPHESHCPFGAMGTERERDDGCACITREIVDQLHRGQVSAPVVAAELRRMADEPGMGFLTGPHDVSAAMRLRARADELDPAPARALDGET